MATTIQQSEKFLTYDGDCPMCTSTVALLVRAKLVRPEQLRNNHVLEGDDLQTVRAAGIRNQLVVLDPATRETRSGTDGLVWIIGDNFGHPFWVRVLAWPGVRQALRWGYETVSYNRRVISPPRTQIVCDCEPEVTLGRRLMLIVPAVVLGMVLWAAFGAAAAVGCDLGTALEGTVAVKSAVGLGFGAMAAAALIALSGQQRIDYIAHLAATLFVGGLVLAPGAIVMPLVPREASIVIASVSAVASAALMFAMQRRRVAAIGLSTGWLWGWATALLIALAGVSYAYFWQQT